MGKKKGKRQSDPSRDGCESTDDEGEDGKELQHSTCPHTGKAVNLSNIKKILKMAWVRVGQCAPCFREKKTATKPVAPPRGVPAKDGNRKGSKSLPAEDTASQTQERIAELCLKSNKSIPCTKDEPPAIWLCLSCGSQNCGKNVKDHCLQHYLTPRSDLHCLVMHTDDWRIWCFECNREIYVDSHKKLYEAVEHVKKVKEKPNKQTFKSTASHSLGRVSIKDGKDQVNSSVQNSLPRQTSVGAGVANNSNLLLPKVKGLNNLGNTCFFNSVMQCLSQTHPLTRLVDIHSAKGATLSVTSLPLPSTSLASLPGASYDSFSLSSDATSLSDYDLYDDYAESSSDLKIQLPEGGPMITSLAAFFKEMHAVNKTGSLSPSHLFGQVVKQSPKFRGMQQQDSQELLRYLMDGLRSEESKRQKSAILKHFGLSEKTDPKTVPDRLKKKMQIYGRYGNHTLLDKLFSGQMVSTIVCEECHYSSQTYEQFLDLSLPVFEDKPHKSAKRNGHILLSGPIVLPDDDDGTRVTCCGVQEEPVKKKTKGQIKKDKRKKKALRKGKAAVAKLENKKDGDDGDDDSESKIRKELIETEKNEKGASSSVSETPNSSLPLEKHKNKTIANKIVNGTGANNKNSKKNTKSDSSNWKDCNDDDEDEEGYEEEEEDCEWDYGEQWDETEDNNKEDTQEKDEESDYVEFDEVTEISIVEAKPSQPLRSLNPLPPEMINQNYDREASTEPNRNSTDEDGETGASSNGDVEDNDLEVESRRGDISSRGWIEAQKILTSLEEADPIDLENSKNIDPHMQELCMGIRRMSVAGGEMNKELDQNGFSVVNNNHLNKESVEKLEAEEVYKMLRNEWTARTLVSLAPRYQTKPGECTVYSCLNHFTQSELLTGSNKWACSSCTELRRRRTRLGEGGSSSSQLSLNDNNADTDKQKVTTVYSNASKQFLIFAPPLILTLHLKRFQQTLVGCKKVNKHVSFPTELDLAPFCSSTCIATPNIAVGQTKILYSLYGIVEHSGRLQGGHYTAYVKVRPVNHGVAGPEPSELFSPPVSRSDDIPRFLQVIRDKLANINGSHKVPHSTASNLAGRTNDATAESTPTNRSSLFIPDTTDSETLSAADSRADSVLQELQQQPRKWFYVSDTSVTEVSEDKVLKAQAYLLFYERML